MSKVCHQHQLPLPRVLIVGKGIGLGELCLKLPVLCYAGNSWKCNNYASEEAVLCSHYAQLCNGIFTFDPSCMQL